MKPLYKDWEFWLAVLAAMLLCWWAVVGEANAQVINAKGAAGVPIAVTTQATVLDFKDRKTWTMNWTDTGDLMCEPIARGQTTPAVTPTSTVGFRLTKAAAPWNSNNLTDNPALGWSCICTSGTCNVYTYEGF